MTKQGAARRMACAALALSLLALPARAGKLLDTRLDDKDRQKLEKVEELSQKGALSGRVDAGAHRAGKGFTNNPSVGSSGRVAVPVGESPFIPTEAKGSITSGGPVKGTPYVANCYNAGLPCKNVTPYQKKINPILREIKQALLDLKLKIIAKSIPVLGGLAALASLTYILIYSLAVKVIAFARRSMDQRAQARLLAATALELQVVAEEVRKGIGGTVLSILTIDKRVKKAGEKARKEIKDRLGPKE